MRGDLNILATDAIGTSYADKTKGRTVVDVQGGNIGIEIRMGVAYSEGVVKQGMSLERYVDITSTLPAKLLGFYPRKGAIAAGSDADIVVMDPNVRKTIAMEDLHIGDYNPWEGWEVQGWPTVVTLRGRVMVNDGRFMGDASHGRLIPRKLSPAVLKGPIS
jgi:dihydropyrimidinase